MFLTEPPDLQDARGGRNLQPVIEIVAVRFGRRCIPAEGHSGGTIGRAGPGQVDIIAQCPPKSKAGHSNRVDAGASTSQSLASLAAGIDNAVGALLTAVEPGGPASAAGLLRQDLVVALDGIPVTGVDDLIRLLSAERIGRSVTVRVLRLGKLRDIALTPVERRVGHA